MKLPKTISTSASLSDINQVVAHLEGWREAFPVKGRPHKETRKGGILLPYHWVNERTHERWYGGGDELPDYTKDARLIVSMLDRFLWTAGHTTSRKLNWVCIDDRGHIGHGESSTLCAAACLARIEAAGVKVLKT